MSAPQPAPAIDAATILLLRDGADGRLEVFMVVRHHQIDFASGALVFPGGKAAKGDLDPAVMDYCDGAEALSDHQRHLRLAAIREAFEESGLILARREGQQGYLSKSEAADLMPYRQPLDKGEMGLAEFLSKEQLRLDLGALQPFAHWVTPDFMPKRFDTYFFLAEAPEGQFGLHDGRESIDSTWINPGEALAAAKRKERTVIFPTRMNLEMLAESSTVDEAMEAARNRKIVTVLPKIESRGDKKVLCIPKEAGYSLTEEFLENING